MKQIKTIGIIGMGNVGNCIFDFIQEKYNSNNSLNTKHLQILWICSKHFNKNINPIKIFNEISEIDTNSEKNIPDLIIIGKTDKNIEATSNELTQKFNYLIKDKFIIHLSGTFGTELLSECKKYSAKVVAAHPFQTFFSKEAKCLKNISWGIECEKNDEKKFAEFIKKLNGEPYFLTDNTLKYKGLYHSISVCASNYISASIMLANLISEEIQINQLKFLKPIINQTVENFSIFFEKHLNDKSKFPLSGPIPRADFATIEKHLNDLQEISEKNHNKFLLNSYSHFGFGLLEIAKSTNKITDENYNKFKEIFNKFLENN